MKVPHTRATKTMQQVVRLRSDTFTVTRQTGVEKVGMGETRQTEDTVEVDALLYAPSTSSDMLQFGDRLGGDLNGLALPEETVREGDEFDMSESTFTFDSSLDATFSDNGVYEVATVENRPSDTDVQLQRFALERITNDR
jgi:hypothetical protein